MVTEGVVVEKLNIGVVSEVEAGVEEGAGVVNTKAPMSVVIS